MTDRARTALYDTEAALRLVDSTLQDMTGIASTDEADPAPGSTPPLLSRLGALRDRLVSVMGRVRSGDLSSEQLAQVAATVEEVEPRLASLASAFAHRGAGSPQASILPGA